MEAGISGILQGWFNFVIAVLLPVDSTTSFKGTSNTEFYSCIWVLTMEGFLCNWKLGDSSFPKCWENTKGVHCVKKNSNSSQKVELFINISIWFFLEFHQWREVLMVNPTMAMNPLLTASGQQRIPLVPSPFEPLPVDRYLFPT